ncbi:RAD52 [Hepatospora eriocheir]|uniref:RAD52 n=1 Tax=Hepatospora eriocheir TaxID=1081669 RepID=A0A1X0QK57_9MICR|nr:RAD52 [Hepatospora eriocheir]
MSDEEAFKRTMLNKGLGPEFLSKRPGYNKKTLVYIESNLVIDIANRIFGYDGWSSEKKEFKIEFIDEKDGTFTVCCSCISRITLKNGTYKEDIGFGNSVKFKNKTIAIEDAAKEAFTDSYKRCFRQFGFVLGNCLYNKEFIKNVENVRNKQNYQFDPMDLFRYEDLKSNEKQKQCFKDTFNDSDFPLTGDNFEDN